DDREDFFALLVFVAGIADPIAAFLGHGVGAIAMQDTEIEVVVRRQMPHTGDKCLFKRSIVGPFRESFVDCRVMDSRLSVGCPWDRQALPLHACVEHPQNEVEDAMIAEFTPRPPPGHRQVRKDKCAHDSPHFQTTPKVPAKIGNSASIAANRSIKGSSRTTGMVGMRSESMVPWRNNE